MIQLGAEVEASGLADLLGHDPEAVFGMLTEVVKRAETGLEPGSINRLIEMGRERRKKVAEAVPPGEGPSEEKRGRKKRVLPGGRIAIRFASPPPEVMRLLLRAHEYRWRLGLRAWVGNEALDETTLEYVRDFGGEILPGPDASEGDKCAPG